jgi:hypothetical protein
MSEEHPPMSTPTPEQLRSLLLHRLPEDEAQRLEEQLMQDAEVADLLRHEETDLVDDYAAGRLAAGDRQAFEQHLLADPGIRQRVKVARALQDIAAKRAAEVGPDGRLHGSRGGAVSAAKPRPWNRWPVRAAAVFVLCVFAVGLLMRGNRQAEIPAPPSQGPAPAIAAQTPDAALDTGPTDVPPPSIVLLADVQRGGGPQVVQARPGAAPVRLQAEATSSDSSVSYRLSITDEAGGPVFSAQDLRPLEAGGYVFVEVSIPGGTLGTGRRTVTLQPQQLGVESFTWQLDVQPAN